MAKSLFVIAAALTIGLPVMAQNSIDAPMTQAVMRVYDLILQETPTDYQTLMSRAQEYYNHDEYVRALSDVDAALRYTPESEKELRFQGLCLRANIKERGGHYDEALADLKAAQTIDPTNYVCIYQKANMEYEIGDYSAAKADYQVLQRMYPRSQEALFGLARVAVKENNIGLANDYADQAVELTPSQSDPYLRRASVRSLMGNTEGAVDDYILAVSMDDANTPRALKALVTLSNTDYPAVMSGLTRAIRQAPRSGMYYYIRAIIAQSHFNYSVAIADLDRIINERLDSYPGLNKSLAECFYALGKYDTALANADYAISASASNAPYYALKAQILVAMNQYDEAIASADRALEKDPNLNNALLWKSIAEIKLGRPAEASVLLAEAILNDSFDPWLFILRGWVNKSLMGQTKLGDQIYERTLDIELPEDEVRSLRGFALLAMDRRDEAVQWMENILTGVNDSDGLIHYYGACMYAQTGNNDRAIECMETALKKGFADYHAWMSADLANVNVAPLRSDARFAELMNRYASIFDR